MKLMRFITTFAIALLITSQSFAQLTPWKTFSFLEEKVIDELIGEMSGERAMKHLLELAAYNKNRPASEFGDGTFREAAYVLGKLKEYGIEGAQIERFPGGESWDAVDGQLWEISPHRRKMVDYEEIGASLAPNSLTTDVEAELVWVGEGRASDFDGKDVKGKIAVSYASGRTLARTADRFGAIGIVSIYSPRPTFDPTQILWTSITTGDNVKFGFYMPPKTGLILKNRLVAGEKIKVHAKIESNMHTYEIQDPTGYIPGTDPDAQEIILTAHLFEGYSKQGANDDLSGSSALLELARAMKVLIDEGRIPPPKRTIRFLWIPEYAGSRPWAAAHPELMKKTLANINMDMVGAQLTKSYSLYSVMRTTFGNPHYINDVVEHWLKYVGQVNREILQNRRGEKILKPIMAPTGSSEPLYFSIETHYGSSDHEVFNDIKVRVPGVLMITWPDQWYHTSGDRPDKSDPTQLKRAGFITMAAAYTIASADDKMAKRMAGEILSYGNNRLGHQLSRGFNDLQDVNVENFESVYKRVRGHIEGAAINEVATLETTLELAKNIQDVGKYVGEMQKAIIAIKDANLNALDVHMMAKADELGVKKISLKLSKVEKEASKMIASPLESLKTYSRSTANSNKELFAKYPTRRVNTSEINLLINGKNSALDIKKMLDVQFEDEADVEGVMNHIKILEELGMIKR